MEVFKFLYCHHDVSVISEIARAKGSAPQRLLRSHNFRASQFFNGVNLPCSLRVTRIFRPFLKLLLFLDALSFFVFANTLLYNILIMALFDLMDAFLNDILRTFLRFLQTIITLLGKRVSCCLSVGLLLPPFPPYCLS